MSSIVDQDENYTYEIMQEKHLEESTRLLANTFTKDNPLEVYLKTTYEQFYAQALAFTTAVLDEQLSIVAVHKQSKEIHGIVQAGDAKKMEGREFEEMKEAKDSEVFEELERRWVEYYGQLKENELAQILMAGVRSDCSGKGLCTKLQQVLLAHCRQRGFKRAIVHPANPISYHIYVEKLKGKVITSIHLPTFVSKNGEKPFEDYDADIQVVLLDLQ